MLANNILKQMTELRRMGKHPTTFTCDAVSLDCLLEEIKPTLSLLYPQDYSVEPRIYGLRVEICDETNFEVT